MATDPEGRAPAPDAFELLRGGEPAHEALQESLHAPRKSAQPDWRRATGSDGATRVSWRPAHGALPKNEHFDLDVRIERDDAPVEVVELLVRADMPEHGHGMNVEPRALRRPDGTYRVRGLLLHMAGRWELAIHAVELGRSCVATFALEVR